MLAPAGLVDLVTRVEPAVLYDAGFQLTALATLGLPLLVPPIARRLRAPLGRWGRTGTAAVVAELLAVTVAAQIATLPVLALTFHQVSLVAPLANLLAVPLLAPLLVLGGAVAALGLIGGTLAGGAALVLGWILWPLLWFVDSAIELCAGLPFAALAVPETPAALAWVYYAALAGARWWLPGALRRGRGATTPTASVPAAPPVTGHIHLGRTALAALLVLVALGGCGATVPALARGTVARLDFLDVGPGGEATLLRLP